MQIIVVWKNAALGLGTDIRQGNLACHLINLSYVSTGLTEVGNHATKKYLIHSKVDKYHHRSRLKP